MAQQQFKAGFNISNDFQAEGRSLVYVLMKFPFPKSLGKSGLLTIPYLHFLSFYLGWLLKEGHGMISNWAERYFVLNTKTKTLSYYDNSDKKAVNKKGEYAFDSSKCKVEASSAKA